MEPRDIFDIGVRVAGVFALLWGVWDLANAALFYTGYFMNPDMTFRYYLIYGWISIFIGMFFLRASAIVVNFSYGLKEIENEVTVTDNPDCKNK